MQKIVTLKSIFPRSCFSLEKTEMQVYHHEIPETKTIHEMKIVAHNRPLVKN